MNQQQLSRPLQYGGPAAHSPTPTQAGPPPSGLGYGQAPFGYPVQQYGPGPTLATPRRRNPLGLLLAALIVLAVAALVGLVAVGMTSTTPATQYQNDDYQVPPPDANPPAVPQPDSYAQAEDWVTKNAFYAESVPAPVRCHSQPINVTSASDAQLKSHFEGLMECLVRVWQPPVKAAGFQIVRPTVTIYGHDVTTKCGQSGVNAFYCSGDQQVYYSNQLPDVLKAAKNNKWTADVVMAHEFGHALQARTGIFVSSFALGQQSGDAGEKLSYSRRSETQADCFSGMFVRSVSTSLGVQQDDLPGIYAVYVAVGDDTLSGEPDVLGNHGLARSRVYWGQTGLADSSVEACNTFVAAPRLVR